MPFTLRDFRDSGEQATKVSRYLTFEKFVSLIELNAVWFSSLASLQDEYEGTLPKLAFERLHSTHISDGEAFPIEHLRGQFAGMATRNITDGRDLTVVNCWFLSGEESKYMWQNHTSNGTGILIFSTIARLNAAFPFAGDAINFSQLGRVTYVDFASHDLPTHIASDSGHRSFLKHHTFRDENELRLTTLNCVAPYCLNPDGTPPSAEQLTGIGMTQPGRKGIYVRCSLHSLIEGIVISPTASSSFRTLIRRLAKRYQLQAPVHDSRLAGL